MAARIQPLSDEAAAPAVKETFDKMAANGAAVLNIYRTLGHSPGGFKGFITLGRQLLYKGTLPGDLRELVIVRVSELTKATYEHTKHMVIGKNEGLTQEKLTGMGNLQSGGYSEKEIAALNYTKEVTLNVQVKDETFTALNPHFSPAEIVELTLVIGYYNMVSRFLEPLGVELEADPDSL